MTEPQEFGAADPAAAAADLRARVETATHALLATAATLSDEQAREPSLLPGWSRGHLLTHLARNADGLRNLLVWARTGVETPQYATPQAREEDIAAGADRPAAELLADDQQAAAAFAAAAASLAPGDWTAEVHGIRGSGHQAWFTLWRRLSELEIHHVDLGAGYTPADWPEPFPTQCLTRAAADFDRPDCPPAWLRSIDDGAEYQIGPSSATAITTVTGRTHELLAWLIGRSKGEGLSVDPPAPLPVVPSW